MDSFNSGGATVYVDEENLTAEVRFDMDGWDDQRKGYRDIEYFSDGDNDIIASDIEETLEEHGLQIIFPGELSSCGEEVTFDLAKI